MIYFITSLYHIFVKMKPVVKNTLISIAAFVGYRFYKMYELGASIIYKPYDWKFQKVDWANINNGGVTLEVTMEILNATNTNLAMRGIDGLLTLNGQNISTFFSQPFTITGGRSYFKLYFKLQSITLINQILDIIKNNKNGNLAVTLRCKIPFFTLVNKFNLNVTKNLLESL